MARRKKHEEHVNAEAWAIPYGDLVTLLFALFTVMYAVSSVNEGKFRVLSDSMIAAFHGAPKSVHPINFGEKDSGKGAGGEKKLTGVAPTVFLKMAPPKTTEALILHAEIPGSPDRTADDRVPGVLGRLERQVQDAMQSLIAANLVIVRRENLWLEIQINTDLLFPSGSGSFAAEAAPVIDKLAEVLKPFANPIRVEGHTDDRPIRTAAFPSNWELSAARSASVVHEFTKAGIDPMRLEIVGFGEFRPLQPNDSVAGRNANRRVSILVLDGTAAESAAAKAAGSPAAAPSVHPVSGPAAAAGVPASTSVVPASSAVAAQVGSATAPNVHPLPGPAAAAGVPATTSAVPASSDTAAHAAIASSTSASGATISFARVGVPPGNVGLAPSAHAGVEKTVLTKPTGKPE